MAADSGTTTSSPPRGTWAKGDCGGSSSTMLPPWSSASTMMEGLGSPVISRPAQMRSTMQGTTSTLPSSCAWRSFTAAESFSQAYSTGRCSSSFSGSMLSLGPSQDATPLPREQLKEDAFCSRKSHVCVSFDSTRWPQPSREQPNASSTSQLSSTRTVSVTSFMGLQVLPLTLSSTKSEFDLMSLSHALEGRCRMTYGCPVASRAGITSPRPSRPAPMCTWAIPVSSKLFSSWAVFELPAWGRSAARRALRSGKGLPGVAVLDSWAETTVLETALDPWAGRWCTGRLKRMRRPAERASRLRAGGVTPGRKARAAVAAVIARLPRFGVTSDG
mmetsp:Transcript_10293/g.26404  ORF Transcript_10293/g.26404 Transcript_10293/m.26404 type:complete len:331 (+) Transcript_10293:2005-2997(+)